MTCPSCAADKHEECTGDMADPEIECRTVACDCLHDPALMQRNAKVADLLRRAADRFVADDLTGTMDCLRRILGILDPPRGKLVDLGARWRGHTAAEGAVREGPGKSSCVETAAGLPEWMDRK